MNIEVVKKMIDVTRKHSPNCFISPLFELIVEPRNNIYFRLEDVETDLDMKCKVLAWLSRPSCKEVGEQCQKKMRAIFNEYLGTDFSVEQIEQIYTYLGNDCNREKTIKFIESHYDFNVLTETVRYGS